MRVAWLFLVLLPVVLAGSTPSVWRAVGRHQVAGQQKAWRYLVVPDSRHRPHERPPQPAVYVFRSSDIVRSDRAESRAFNDFPSYVGSYIYQGAVRRVFIQPLLQAMKRLVPKQAVVYYNNQLANRRFFRMTNRFVRPVVSSYIYGKFEEGVFGGIKRGYTFVRDNLIEFEDDADDIADGTDNGNDGIVVDSDAAPGPDFIRGTSTSYGRKKRAIASTK